MAWCKAPDAGLPVPDVLIHLVLKKGEAEARGGFGGERYEVSEFQERVRAKVKRISHAIFFCPAAAPFFHLVGPTLIFAFSKYAELYASGLEQTPTELDVTGMSIDDVGARIDELVEAAWSRPRRSEKETLW